MLKLALVLLGTCILIRRGAEGSDRSLLQSQHPPCMSKQSGWYQCTAASGESPGALCLPLCLGDSADGPCQPCSDANRACNTAWSAYNGKLQASLSFNSTEICPQLATRMASGSSSGGCSCPCGQQG
ncbi:hypothetical protein CVIRNUC_008801 [Coccomyxa viridis]|uniref:Uncharacterized protein n=1 Tax=Coccomyxa viridis TaxID=1274662 RepID=A0AAV1IFL1_9CHLO|nr:hypothetical protein CVIRNUC_008801 [Coccomyxa viridis]